MNFSNPFLVRRYQEQFSSANLPVYVIVGVLPLLVTSKFRAAEKTTRLYFARTVSLLGSLPLLFGGVLLHVAVVVFVNLVH